VNGTLFWQSSKTIRGEIKKKFASLLQVYNCNSKVISINLQTLKTQKNEKIKKVERL